MLTMAMDDCEFDGLDLVTVVTVSAHGRAGIATGNGLRVNAVRY